MAKPKNTAFSSTKQSADDLAVSRLVIITSLGHRISRAINSKTVCGEYRTPWHYGEAKDVSCKQCLDLREDRI